MELTEDVLAETGAMTCVSAAEPVECQKPTVFALKSCCLLSAPHISLFSRSDAHDLIRNIVPHACIEGGAPLRHPADIPPEVRVRRARLPTDEPVLHLGEVALEEAHLVLVGGAGRVGGGALHAEVVVDLASVDGRGCLWDELRASHGLPVPVRGRIDGKLGALLGGRVGGVLVGGGEVDVRADVARAVDVVLVVADFVAE